MILFLVRHGETESNRNSLALGRADVPLNSRGLAQAARLGNALADDPISAVYSSPLIRAQQTAATVASRRGLSVQVKPGLIEMDIGEADGLTFPQVRERFPGLLETWVSDAGPEHPMPGGERLTDVQRRAWECVQSLARIHSDDTICAVTHNFVILTILATALGIDLSCFRRLRHSVAAISVLDVGPSRIRIKRMNDTCHLHDG
jgi:broad specificity phosphatase PhoE